MCAKLDDSASQDSDSAGMHDAADVLACAESISDASNGSGNVVEYCFNVFINKHLYLCLRNLESTAIFQ
jgi:hypothetical protein